MKKIFLIEILSLADYEVVIADNEKIFNQIPSGGKYTKPGFLIFNRLMTFTIAGLMIVNQYFGLPSNEWITIVMLWRWPSCIV